MTRRRLRPIVALAALLCVVLWWLGYRSRSGAPSLEGQSWHHSRRVLDRHGRLLRDVPNEAGLRGEPLPLALMGDRLVLATLISEDKRFYRHSGVDARALYRAVGQNARQVRVVSGASTITQQLVKLLDQGGHAAGKRDLGVKLHEAARARNLEEKLGKAAILEAYLNRLTYRSGLVGPRAAARALFGVEPHQLSWAEAALLAVLPRAPSYLDPYAHRERAVKRQRALLAALCDAGAIDEATRDRALGEPLSLEPVRHVFEAPHFIGQLPAGTAGRTTLDLELQHEVEGLVATHMERLAERRAGDAAVLVVHNASGEILAYAGSAGWDDDAISGRVDMVRARRQPGSTLKPFVYQLAFEQGMLATELVADVPARFGEGSGSYAPRNFDRGFLGPVSAREALAGSLNVPAVRLGARVGPAALLARLRLLGMGSLDRGADHYGVSLALGSGEVTLLELARAYVALARGGEAVPLSSRRAPDELGSAVAGRRVMDAGAAAAVSESLSDPLARVRVLGGRGPFDLGFPVAVKTGTSSGYRDSWTVGYTRALTVAVWVGNADGRGTRELTGGSGAGPLFADVMRVAVRDHGAGDDRPPWDKHLLQEALVCPLSGLPAGPDCPHAAVRLVHAGAAGRSCRIHRRARRMGDGMHCDPRGPVAIVEWPAEYAAWLAALPPGAPGRDPHGRPWLAGTPGCGGEARPPAFEAPADGSVVVLARAGPDDGVDVRLAYGSNAEVELLLDGRKVATLAAPHRVTLPMARGDHLLQAVVPGAGVTAVRFAVR